MERQNRLVPVKNAEGLPYTRRTIYKMNSQKRLQDVLVKVGGTLFWDEGAWERRVHEARERQLQQVTRLREVL